MRLVACALLLSWCGCEGIEQRPGAIVGPTRSEAAQEAARRDRVAAGAPAKSILFGDLHVHTSYSWDAFMSALPLFGSDGAHPPADACDFARHCAGLDFFAITDHAETLLPQHWSETQESLRACAARAGDARDPDVVPFAGFEWSHVGQTPETHYGHRCVIFPELEAERLPARPIAARDDPEARFAPFERGFRIARWLDPLGWRRYTDVVDYLRRLQSLPACPKGVPVRELPATCLEGAATPAELHAKLDDWGLPALVIPHGMTWGTYTPAGSNIRKHLAAADYDPARQRLIEVYSGHGNSEEYRRFREREVDSSGAATCPAPSADYLPCCWRAGEIMRERCGDLAPDECKARVEEAKRLALEAGLAPNRVFPDTRPEEWLDCDQCRTCFKPAYSYRPRESVQYAMALAGEERDAEGRRLRFRYGFVGSSDNHSARPGTGYKQVARDAMTDARGVASDYHAWLVGLAQRRHGDADPRRPQPVPPGRDEAGRLERATSFLYPGGLAAVHAEGRSREAIWSALQRREAYATSGPRILLWFDLVNAGDGPLPMGSEAALAAAPRFSVRAVGDFVQAPGCPGWAGEALGTERVASLCRGECWHPGGARHPIAAIEIVRIRPQREPDEPVDGLVEDPWRRFDCAPDAAGCRIEFEDPEFRGDGREVLYYARALQEPTPAINGAGLRTRFDAEGRAVGIAPCYGGARGAGDDCLAPVQERAWSSPIFVAPALEARGPDGLHGINGGRSVGAIATSHPTRSAAQ
jgi:hypothetical protein